MVIQALRQIGHGSHKLGACKVGRERELLLQKPVADRPALEEARVIEFIGNLILGQSW